MMLKKGGTLVVIYGIKEYLNPNKAQLSDVIQESMTQVLGLPESKRAHRIVPLDKSDFYYPQGRSDAYTVIEINMMEGRRTETKKAPDRSWSLLLSILRELFI